MPPQSSNKRHLEHQARRGLTLLFTLALLMALTLISACSNAPFSATPERASIQAPTGPATIRLAPTLDTLDATLIATLTTWSNTPSPAFSPNGRLLAYHAEKRDDEERYFQRSELHVLDVPSMTDRIVRSDTASQVVLNNNSFGYETTDYATEQDLTYHPVILPNGDILSAGKTPPSSYSTEPHVQRMPAHGGRSVTRFAIGGVPRMSPSGDRVTVQTSSAIAIIEPNGHVQKEVPGYFGVWSPDGTALIGHFRPWRTYDYWANSPMWPAELQMPSANEGGLFLWREDTIALLTQKGGNPTWRADGNGFAFEAPTQNDQGSTLHIVERSFEKEDLRVVGEGRHPAYHPAGKLLVYETPEGLTIADSKTTRLLGLDGLEPLFNHDGSLLVVQVPSTLRQAHGARELPIYRVTW